MYITKNTIQTTKKDLDCVYRHCLYLRVSDVKGRESNHGLAFMQQGFALLWPYPIFIFTRKSKIVI